jgi:hypothetical protein
MKQNMEDIGDIGEFNKALDTKISTFAKPKPKKPEDEEGGVMDYMTEQVFKDSFTGQHGEFKDRGFKKPVNYAHWLAINEG